MQARTRVAGAALNDRRQVRRQEVERGALQFAATDFAQTSMSVSVCYKFIS